MSSAIGRCASVVLGTEEKASKESMIQVENLPKSFVEDDPWSKPFGEDGFHTASTAIADIKAQLGGELIAEAPQCSHGHRVWREGVSSKTGKAWANYSCTEKSKTTQCAPLWYVLAADGQWKPQV